MFFNVLEDGKNMNATLHMDVYGYELSARSETEIDPTQNFLKSSSTM